MGFSTATSSTAPSEWTAIRNLSYLAGQRAAPARLNRHPPLCTLRAAPVNVRPDTTPKGPVDLAFYSGWSREKSFLLGKHVNPQHTYLFHEVDQGCLESLLIEGAEIIEWAFVEAPESEMWVSLERTMERRKVLVFFDEVRAENHPVSSHNILMMTRADESRIDVAADLNGWKLDQLSYVAFLVKVPLVSNDKVANLPNPVRPFPPKQTLATSTPRRLDSIASSFGFDDNAASQLGSEKTLSVIPADFRTTVLYQEIIATANRCGIRPGTDVPETALVLNGAFSSATTNSMFRRTLTKQTGYMSIGADLYSPISYWQLRPIWETGGLVTFSPTFFLFQHRTLADIMKVIRSAPNWAAYITPTTLLYVDKAIEQAKGFNPVASFAALTHALFLDDNQRRIGGEMSSDTSGIVVSSAPPMPVSRSSCERWLDWLGKIFDCTDHTMLLKLCRQWTRIFHHDEAELGTDEVEKISMGDLIKMRNMPHSVLYRRCIYVGSIKEEQKREGVANGIDVISPDEFFSTFMGSV
ncbi:hypothetical protein CspeluHIS016_0205910 [Cutaneotrichosporon spelunceum]|uniref:Uncharacterized protein n=1 Tax=Cutaneotrichosporon spelunceum TaxID=1672016 RepID=A0AAD3YA13_9TREE|nr:hypothetical protein CspeluHIS016_0205910 [Cutaneotrichosporon spelunceum]